MATPTKVCIFNPTSKLIDIVNGVDGSVVPAVGVAQAGLPVVLNPNGAIDPTLTGTAIAVLAGEAINAGNLVNLYAVGNVLTVQKAFADATGTAPSGSSYPVPAQGFAGSDIGLGGTGVVSFNGVFQYTDLLSEFSPTDVGVEVFLSTVTVGGITKTRPSGGGQLIQAVGYVLAVDDSIVSVLLLAGFNDFAQISGVAQIAQGGTGATTETAAQENIFGTQSANTVYAGPASGPVAFPAFRALVAADLPSTSGAYVQTAPTSDQTITGGHQLLITGVVAPSTAGGTTAGSTALPFSSIFIGGAATNNIRVTGTASAARVFTLPDANSNAIQPLGSATPSSWVQYTDAAGVQHLLQPAFSDISGFIAPAQLVPGAVNLLAQAANVATTVLYAVPVASSGLYRISVFIEVTQAASSTSTLPDTRLVYQSPDSLATQTVSATTSDTGNLAGVTFKQTTFVVNAKASTNIRYDIGQSTPYASSGGTPMQFSYHARVEYLG